MTLVVAISIAFGASAGPVSAAPNDDERVFVQLINQIRAEIGLHPLTVDAELTTAARSWSSTMADDDSLAHSPDMAAGVSAQWTILGENVGVHGIHDLSELFQAFVDSPSHYRNLIDPRFHYVGVGVVHAPNGKLWTTHKFMATSTSAPTATTDSAPPATPAPTVPPTTTPQTAAPTTAAPTTKPPVTAPSAPQPVDTSPPATTPPADDPVDTKTPNTKTPETKNPNTKTPNTKTPNTKNPETRPSTTPEASPAESTPAQPAADPIADKPLTEVQTPSETTTDDRAAEDMADLVNPDAETIETVLLDLMLAGV